MSTAYVRGLILSTFHNGQGQFAWHQSQWLVAATGGWRGRAEPVCLGRLVYLVCLVYTVYLACSVR
jgi:hypothetical protein